MKDKLWKIRGTGYYFQDFYVVAWDEEEAKAKALDILEAEHRAGTADRNIRKNLPASATSQIRLIEFVPEGAEILRITS